MRGIAATRIALRTAVLAMASCALLACEQWQGAEEEEEQLPAIRPNLPPVPSLPPPRHPLQYDDGTWTVYGLRKRLQQTMDQEVRVKALVVKIFQPTPCPEGRTCPLPPMPHLWLGDDLDETSEGKLLRLVGYANSQEAMDQARENAEKGKAPTEEELAMGLTPAVWDWQAGKRYVVKGRFVRASSSGFSHSEGLLEYMERQCLDCPPPEEEPSKNR